MQLIFSNCFHGKRSLWELKLVKRRKTSIFIVNKRLREATVKFLTEHDKKEFKYCIITLYIEETPDTNISDTSNELKQVSAHNCFYIQGVPKKFARIRRTQSPYSGYTYLMCRVFAHRIFILKLKTAYYTCIV